MRWGGGPTKARLRLAASVAVAVALHLALFFGVALPGLPAAPAVIEVALATAPSLAASPQAETTDAISEPERPEPASSPESSLGAESAAESKPPPTAEERPEPASSPEVVAEAAPSAPPVDLLAGRDVADLARAVAASAMSEAKPAGQNSASRVRRLGGAALPLGADFAYYLQSWRRKVERIGQLNYPREARAEGIVGSLRLLVTIAPDGALNEVRVLETSGHPLLDDAALRIVRLAAPYAPFSPAMRATTDLLEIERTWRFLNSRLSS